MNLKQLIPLALALSVGASAAGIAAAQENTPPMNPGDGMFMQPGDGFGGEQGFHQGQGGPRGGGRRGRDGGAFVDVIRVAVETAAEQTGLETTEIVSQVRDGATLADVVTNNGGDVQAVIDATVAAAETRINEAVSNGRLAQARADQMLQNLPAFVESAVNGDYQEMRQDFMMRRIEVGLGRLAAEMTGLSLTEIRTELEGGATLADVLSANGVTTDAFIAEAVERFEARLNVAVADDRLTAEEAAQQVETFRAELTERITQPLDQPATGAV